MAISHYKELRAVLSEQQRHSEAMQQERERQQSEFPGRGGGLDRGDGGVMMISSLNGLLTVQGTSHYETMSHQVRDLNSSSMCQSSNSLGLHTLKAL